MSSSVIEREVEVRDSLGLHARPAAKFAERAALFVSDISVSKGPRSADAKSILLVLTLDLRQGDRVTLRAEGPDALRAVQDLADLMQGR